MQKLIAVAAVLAGFVAAAPSLADDAPSANSAAAASMPAPMAAGGETYTVVPMPPADTRNKFIPPTGAVFIVNQTTDTVAMCFPDTDKNNNYVVSCTPATDLPK